MRLSHRLVWDAGENQWAEVVSASRIAYDLTLSNPTEAFGSCEDGRAWGEEVLSALHDQKLLRYAPHPFGWRETREFLAGTLFGGKILDADDILLTSSTSEAYAFLFKLLCDPGEEVLVPAPSYPLFEYLASLENVKVVSYPLEYVHGRGYEIDFGCLQKRLSSRTKAMVYVHPNNPTGTGAREEEIAQVNDLALRFGFALIVDEVFSDYWLEKPEDVPVSWYGRTTVPTFVMGGLSKSLLLPQMKLAWTTFYASKDEHILLRRAIELVGDTFLSPSLPVQVALPRWWQWKSRLHQMVCTRLRANLSFLRQSIGNGAWRVHTLHGGWTAVLEFPRVISEDELVSQLARRGVKVYPGHFFDFEREGFLVVSLLAPEESIRKGIEVLIEIMKELSS